MKDNKENQSPAGKAEAEKVLGNDCIKEEKFEQAVVHYTNAIILDAKNHALYSNRYSFQYFKNGFAYKFLILLYLCQKLMLVLNSYPAGKAEAEKVLGNDCIKEEKFEQAVVHYTNAIILDAKNHALYSNRSLAYLRLGKHYLALQDANKTIKLQPTWAKGFYRRAEVETAAELYDEAILSYGIALQLEPQDRKLFECIKRVSQIKILKKKKEEDIIWLSTCIGLIIGITIVVTDFCLTEKPTLTNPISMVVFTLVFAAGGFGVGKALTLMKKWEAGKTLTPEEIENDETEENVPNKKHHRSTKAQGRLRQRQGKL